MVINPDKELARWWNRWQHYKNKRRPDPQMMYLSRLMVNYWCSRIFVHHAHNSSKWSKHMHSLKVIKKDVLAFLNAMSNRGIK